MSGSVIYIEDFGKTGKASVNIEDVPEFIDYGATLAYYDFRDNSVWQPLISSSSSSSTSSISLSSSFVSLSSSSSSAWISFGGWYDVGAMDEFDGDWLGIGDIQSSSSNSMSLSSSNSSTSISFSSSSSSTSISFSSSSSSISFSSSSFSLSSSSAWISFGGWYDLGAMDEFDGDWLGMGDEHVSSSNSSISSSSSLISFSSSSFSSTSLMATKWTADNDVLMAFDSTHKAYYRFDLNNFTLDSVGNHLLTNWGAENTTLGKVGNGALFQRVNNDRMVTTMEVPTSKFAISIWANSFGYQTMTTYGLFKLGDIDIFIYRDNTASYYLHGQIKQSDNTVKDANSAVITSGYFHVLFVADGANIRVYLNGNNIATTAYDGTLSSSNGTMYIGRDATASWDYSLDEVSVWIDPDLNVDGTDGQAMATALYNHNAIYTEYNTGVWSTVGKDIVSYYKFENDASDSQNGNYLFGNVQGTPTYVTGKNNLAISFDGTCGIERDGTGPVNPTSDYSISLWFKTSSPQTGDGYSFGTLFSQYPNNANGQQLQCPLIYLASADGVTGSVEHMINWGGPSTSTPIALGDWTHVVAVRRVNNLELWINGVLIDYSTGINGTIEAPYYRCIGISHAGFFGTVQYISQYTGLIDEVMTLQRALTQSEIELLYNNNFGNFLS